MEINGFLKEKMQKGQKCAILGIGSVLRSDDAAGMYFIDLLDGLRDRDDILLIRGSTAPENFTGMIKEFAPEKLFIIDAAFMGLAPGEIKDVPVCDIGGVAFSTHMLPLSVMIKYLESESGCGVIFIGIQPKDTGHGSSMSREVKKGINRLAEEFNKAFNL